MFYLPDSSSPVLSESESQHAVKVLRLGKGQELEWSDGKGLRGKARILDADSRKCRLEILKSETIARPWNGSVYIAIAPTKNLDRMEWLVEKGTEIGCNGFLFFRTARTERDQINLGRLEKVAISAMKQSGQTWLPELAWFPKWDVDIWNRFPNRLLTDLGEKTEAFPTLSADTPTLLLIGPEGDFTPAERTDLIQNGARSVRLCPQVLRTETAALYALALAHARMV